MARRIKIADGRPDGYWRGGVQHSRLGAVFEEDAFTDEEWTRLMNDPALDIERVSEEEAHAPDPDTALEERVARVMAGLTPEDLGKNDGKPKLGVLREALPADAKAIDMDLRDRVWDGLQKAKAADAGQE